MFSESCNYCGSGSCSVRKRIKLDSGASCSMSGITGRIKNVSNRNSHSNSNSNSNSNSRRIEIEGFNGNISLVDQIGENGDGKKEYFVSSMPDDLVLLCAHQYASDGAVVLMKNDGFIIHLDDVEVEEFRNLVKKYFLFKKISSSE